MPHAAQPDDAPEQLLKGETPNQRRIYGKVVSVLESMEAQGLDLPTFLSAVVGIENPACRHARKVANVRSTLYDSPLLPKIVDKWLNHPNNLKGPKKVLRPFILQVCHDILNKELKNLDEKLAKHPTTHGTLLAFDFGELLQWAQTPDGTPQLFSLLYHLASTPRGRNENKKKNPKMVRMSSSCQCNATRRYNKTESTLHLGRVNHALSNVVFAIQP